MATLVGGPLARGSYHEKKPRTIGPNVRATPQHCPEKRVLTSVLAISACFLPAGT